VTETVTATGPQASLSPTSVNFGNVCLGSKSTKTVTLTNTGSSALQISGMVLTFGQADHSDFGFYTKCSTSLAAGQSCAISVWFYADELGAQTATLTITSNAPTSPQAINMTATAYKKR